METYKVTFKDINTEGVYAISLVEEPAMESLMVALSKEENKIQLKTIDEEKRILLGAVLIPDKPIYRNQDGKEFNIIFPKETIQMSMECFFKNGNQNNSTLEHNENMQLKGVTFVESWIKEDNEKDKSNLYGFNEPVGTWFASMKVDNDEVWNDYVKTGKVKGFSIDGFFDLEKVNLKSDYMNIKDEFKKVLIEFGFMPKEEQSEIKLGSLMTENGDIKIMFDGEMVSKGQEVWVVVDDQRMAVPDGEYTMETNLVFVIQDSKVVDILEKKEEEAPAEEAPTEMAEESKSVKSEKSTHEVFYQLSAIITEAFAKQDEKIAGLEAKLSKISTEEKTVEVVSLTKTKGEENVSTPKTAKERLQYAINKVKE